MLGPACSCDSRCVMSSVRSINLQSRAWSARRSRLPPAASATISNLSGCSRTMSSVCVPMEPVLPSSENRCAVCHGLSTRLSHVPQANHLPSSSGMTSPAHVYKIPGRDDAKGGSPSVLNVVHSLVLPRGLARRGAAMRARHHYHWMLRLPLPCISRLLSSQEGESDSAYCCQSTCPHAA